MCAFVCQISNCFPYYFLDDCKIENLILFELETITLLRFEIENKFDDVVYFVAIAAAFYMRSQFKSERVSTHTKSKSGV